MALKSRPFLEAGPLPFGASTSLLTTGETAVCRHPARSDRARPFQLTA